MAHDAARARHRQRRVRRVAESRRPRGRAGHERHRVLRQLVHRRSIRPHARRAPEPSTETLIATCDPKLIEDTRRNWPFLRDRRIDAYAPISRAATSARRRHASTWQSYDFPAEFEPHARRGSPGRTTSPIGPASWSRSRGCTRRSCACCTQHERVEILCHDETVKASARGTSRARTASAGTIRLHVVPERSRLAARLGADRRRSTTTGRSRS